MELVVDSTTFLQSKIAPLKSNMVPPENQPLAPGDFCWETFHFHWHFRDTERDLSATNSLYMDVIIWMGWLDENIDIKRCGFCCTVLPMLQSRRNVSMPLAEKHFLKVVFDLVHVNSKKPGRLIHFKRNSEIGSSPHLKRKKKQVLEPPIGIPLFN